MIKPYYQTELGTLYHGDCFEILPQLTEKVDLVLADPPYGMNWNTDYTRFTGGVSKIRSKHEKIKGDTEPFVPTPFIGYRDVILFGSNHYANKLPKGTWLVWSKKPTSKLGTFLSDCELAWKKGGEGVYLFHQEWDGFNRQGERGIQRVHPTQKPVSLMLWSIGLSKTTGLVLDPFLGSGTTAVACERLGRRWVGIETSATYCDIAVKRIEEERSQLKLNL